MYQFLSVAYRTLLLIVIAYRVIIDTVRLIRTKYDKEIYKDTIFDINIT